MTPRAMAEVRQMLIERASEHRNPFFSADPLVVEEVLSSLQSVEPNGWVEAWSARARPHQINAAAAERAGDAETARREYLLAYEYWRVARYPAPNCGVKQEAYRASQELYLKAAHWFDPPLERVVIPFGDRVIVADLRKPKTGSPPFPLVIHWGGIDSFKEERRSEPYLSAGLAAMAVDMPGVGDAPIHGSLDAERLWDPIFDWVATRGELDATRVAVHGGSTGGYWAAKLAHTRRDRIRAAVNHGGPAHLAFQPEWIARAQTGEYPFELAETLASAFGARTYEDWLAMAPSLSLLEQGVLEQHCAPLLLVNGKHDTIFPVEDMYLLLEHGDPKSVRIYPDEAHMGGPHAMAAIVAWIAEQLL